MLSEGALRAERIYRELAKYSKARGVPEHELEDVAYVLLGAWMLRDESRTRKYLPAHHASELDSLVSNILDVGDPAKIEKQFQAARDLLSEAMSTTRVGIPQGGSILSLAIRHIAGMLKYELLNIDRGGRAHVLNGLFYKLFARLAPSQQRHHALVAQYALPLIEFYGGVLEVQPGSGEVLVISRICDRPNVNFELWPTNLPPSLSEQLRFLRNLRLAAYGIEFENANTGRKPQDLWLFDKSFDLSRSAYGDTAIIFDDERTHEALVRFRQGSNSPMLVVVGGKDRRPLKRCMNKRRMLVENYDLRAVIDFTSFTAKGVATFGLWYFGPSFPGHPDRIVQLDARQLRPNLKTDEMYYCASLVGALLRAWSDGRAISTSELEETGAPRRVIAFIQEALSSGNTAIPGFVRFVTKYQMKELDYSLRAEDYVGLSVDRSWRPEVEIDPILSNLRRVNQCSAVYLIGNNGAGKSLAMRDIAMALALEGQRSFGVSFGTTDRFNRSPQSEPLKSHFTYGGARTFQSGPNTRRSFGELGDMVKDIYRDPSRLDCFEAALSTLGFQPKQFLVPVSMGTTSDHWERLLADVHPLSALSGTQREREELQKWQALPNGAYKLAFMRRDSPEIVVFDSLSSGEQQILTMVIKIVAKVQRNTTVLLDEPEISLHVAWQRQLPHVLHKFSRKLGCFFVVATHSPIVIASADGANDYCFVMQERRLYELTPVQRRSVEASLFEGFQTYTPLTHHVQERCAEIVSRIIGETDEDGFCPSNDITPLNELMSLKQRLGNEGEQGAAHDLALVTKAIAAVQEILAP